MRSRPTASAQVASVSPVRPSMLPMAPSPTACRKSYSCTSGADALCLPLQMASCRAALLITAPIATRSSTSSSKVPLLITAPIATRSSTSSSKVPSSSSACRSKTTCLSALACRAGRSRLESREAYASAASRHSGAHDRAAAWRNPSTSRHVSRATAVGVLGLSPLPPPPSALDGEDGTKPPAVAEGLLASITSSTRARR